MDFDLVTAPDHLPTDQRDYIWANWSSHARSSANRWGDSYLILGEHRINAMTIATEWYFDRHPTVLLAACETSIDSSGGLAVDEYCGLDLAFRVAGARTILASLWAVDDMVAALTAMFVPGWWLQDQLPPSDAITALQRHFRRCDWKRYLLKEERLRALPRETANALREAQGPFWAMPDDVFADQGSWAAFRAHGS